MAVAEPMILIKVDMVDGGPTCTAVPHARRSYGDLRVPCRECRGEGATCRVNVEVDVRRRSFGAAGFHRPTVQPHDDA